jgi:hypothetical protein
METELRNNAFNEPRPYACWFCGAHISAEDNYCRKCGKGQGRFVHWYYKHFGIVFITLFAGPFSLYFVWRSPVLSRNAKWIYTGLIALSTWYVLSAFYRFWLLFQSMFSGMKLL